MSQGTLNYRSGGYEPEENWGPPAMADVFPAPRELSSKSRRLRAYLKSGRLIHPTKREFIPIVDPKGDMDMKRITASTFLDEFPDALKDKEASCLKKVDQVLSEIRNEVFVIASQIRSDRERQRYLYERSEIILPVGKTDSGAFVYAIHHPDNKLPLETLRSAYELYLDHGEKQQKPGKLCLDLLYGAEMISTSSARVYQVPRIITTDLNTPDEQMSIFLDDETDNAQ